MAIPAPASKWILVADDDSAIRDVWTTTLTGAGYHVLTARNGQDALDLMRGVVPNLILLDLRMPEMSGPAVLKAIEGSPVLQQIPVLVISGFLGDDESRDVSGLNIVGRHEKPLRRAELLGVVRAALAPITLPARYSSG
jgi:CheY-like chemotaxis protein